MLVNRGRRGSYYPVVEVIGVASESFSKDAKAYIAKDPRSVTLSNKSTDSIGSNDFTMTQDNILLVYNGSNSTSLYQMNGITKTFLGTIPKRIDKNFVAPGGYSVAHVESNMNGYGQYITTFSIYERQGAAYTLRYTYVTTPEQNIGAYYGYMSSSSTLYISTNSRMVYKVNCGSNNFTFTSVGTLPRNTAGDSLPYINGFSADRRYFYSSNNYIFDNYNINSVQLINEGSIKWSNNNTYFCFMSDNGSTTSVALGINNDVKSMKSIYTGNGTFKIHSWYNNMFILGTQTNISIYEYINNAWIVTFTIPFQFQNNSFLLNIDIYNGYMYIGNASQIEYYKFMEDSGRVKIYKFASFSGIAGDIKGLGYVKEDVAAGQTGKLISVFSP